MVTSKDIIMAVDRELRNKFPDENIEYRDLEEGFEKPSFFISLDNNLYSDFMAIYKVSQKIVRISYFPYDRYNNTEDLLEIQEELSNIFFSALTIGDNFIIDIKNCNSNIVEGVLYYDFQIEYIQEAQEEVVNSDLMEELNINL